MTKENADSKVAPGAERASSLPVRQAEQRFFARRIIAGGLAVAAGIVIIAGLVLWNLRANTVATALADLDSFDLLLAAQTERTFENVDLVVSGIAEEFRADGVDSADKLRRLKGNDATYRLLREKLAGVPQLDALLIIDAKGDVINVSRSYPPGPVNDADRDYFIALRDHPELERFISKPVRNRGTGTWTIYVARRMSAPDGSFIGLVLGAMTLQYFEDFFRDVSLAAGRGINLWRSDGTLLARYPASAQSVGRTFELDEKFREIATIGGAGIFWTHGTFTPTTLAVAERKLSNLPLIVAVGLPEGKILAPWYAQAIVIGAGALSLLLALALAAWLFLRQLAAFALVAEARAKAYRATEARQTLQRAVDRAEQAVRDLRQSEIRFRDIAEVSGDWIWESDAQHRMTSVLGDHVLREETHGISTLGAVGKTRWEMAGVSPDKDDNWRAHRADLDAHRPFRNFRFKVTARSGEDFHLRVSGKPIFDELGRFVGYRGTASNETDLVVALSRAERADTLLREAIDAISEGFAIYDGEDHLVMCNQAYKDLYPESAPFMVPGATFEEVLRGGLAKGQYADAVGREEAWLAERLREHREPRPTPVEQALRNGRWAMISERRLSTGGRAGLRIDITALKNIQQTLRESQERLARAQRVANTGSAERDLRTNRVEWSDETYRILGLRRGLITPSSQLYLDMVHPEDRKKVVERVARMEAEQNAGAEMRYRIVRPDGEVRVIYAEAELVFDADGKPARIIIVIRDVTESEAAAQRQAQLEAQLRHSEKLTALGTLAGGIAHDLNNMLVPIQALTKLVMRELPVQSAARADLETVVQASMQARDLVRQILAFSRKQDIVKQPADLVAITREALQMLRASIPAMVELSEDFTAVPPLLADAGQLHQVVVNLVTNAAHAIGERLGRITVTIAPCDAHEAAGMAICLVIADTGCGMDEATTHRIFEPFYTTKPVGEGTGLGLSVVHGIVTGHGGTIEVRSEPGKGSEFILRLPSCDPPITSDSAELASA